MTLSEMTALNVVKTPEKPKEEVLEQLNRRYNFLIRRFDHMCEKIYTSIPSITVSEIDIQRINLATRRINGAYSRF